MPLRVTVELIPRGDESRKRKVAVVDIANDGTGTHEVGNYDVRAEGDTVEMKFCGRVTGTHNSAISLTPPESLPRPDEGQR